MVHLLLQISLIRQRAHHLRLQGRTELLSQTEEHHASIALAHSHFRRHIGHRDGAVRLVGQRCQHGVAEFLARADVVAFQPVKSRLDHRLCPAPVKQPLRRFVRHRLLSQTLLRLHRIQGKHRLTGASLQSRRIAMLLHHPVLQTAQQKGPQTPFVRPLQPLKHPCLDQMREETLRQILRILRPLPAAPSVGVQRIPVKPAQLSQRLLTAAFLRSGGEDQAPASVGELSIHRQWRGHFWHSFTDMKQDVGANWPRRTVPHLRFGIMIRLVLLILLSLSSISTATSPNIVFIMLDNVGQEWFGCYGSEEGCTPNIDCLSSSGMRVQHCYTAPVCGPSRTVLLTGRYPHSTGFRLHHDAALYSGGGLDPKREVLFPRVFREAGYATGISGKWQVNNLYDEPDVLTAHGFEEQLVWPGSLDPKKVQGAELAKFWDAVKREDAVETTAYIQHIEGRYWDPVFIRNGKREEHPGRFGPDVAQDFAFEFLRKHREKPFMLYYPMMLTHGATFTQPVVHTPDHPEKDLPHEVMFANMLRYADKQIGQFVAELEKLGLRDNTIVFIASDNGTEKSFHARRDGRVVTGGLYTLTEAGGDVVLLANCPKRIPAGRVLPLADFTDVYPTICELANVPLLSNHKPDGQSFAKYLLGETQTPHRDWILNEYHETRVVRDTQFKLYNDGRFFDANADPEEQHDLAQSTASNHRAAKQKLQSALNSLPPDVEPPFHLRSQSGFKLRTAKRDSKAADQ